MLHAVEIRKFRNQRVSNSSLVSSKHQSHVKRETERESSQHLLGFDANACCGQGCLTDTSRTKPHSDCSLPVHTKSFGDARDWIHYSKARFCQSVSLLNRTSPVFIAWLLCESLRLRRGDALSFIAMHNGVQMSSLSMTMRENAGGFLGISTKNFPKGISESKGECTCKFSYPLRLVTVKLLTDCLSLRSV